MHASIYLTGGNVELQEMTLQSPASDWRSQALTKLQRHGLRVVNPLEIAWTPDSPLPIDEPDIKSNVRVLRALDLIDQCDALLANLNRSSYGTAMEIFYAHRAGKVVTVVGPTPFSPWVLTHSKARFEEVEDALDYIIDENPQPEPIDWALQYEGKLAQRYEQLPPAGEPDYRFLGGDLPVLVLAPHATAFFREGEFAEADAFTGGMAALLNRLSGTHALLTYYCCVADPNTYFETPFRRAFAEIVKAGKIGLVVVLMGLHWHETPGLKVYGTKPAQDYANRLRLALMPIEPVLGEESADQLGVIHKFAEEELAVPTLFVKMHKRYRMPRLQPELFGALNQVLSEFIIEIGRELSRGS